MNLYVCPSFVKQLEKVRSVDLDSLKQLLRKYPNTNLIQDIGTLGKYKVLKCYLLQKKVRSMIFLQVDDHSFIPFSIVKKESKKGKNIRKENYQDLYQGDMLRILHELDQDQFTLEEL